MNLGPAPYILRLIAKIATVLLYALTVLAAYGGHVNPYVWALPSVAVLVFPWLLVASLVVGVLWLIGKRVFMAAGAVLTLLCCWGPAGNVFPLHGPSKAPEDAKVFSLMTYNIYHGNDLTKPNYGGNRALEYILALNPDILCLQEVFSFDEKGIRNFSEALKDSLEKRYPYRVTDTRNDLAFFSKYPAEMVEEISAGGSKAAFVDADVYRLNVKGLPLYVVNLHLSSYLLNPEERQVVSDINSIKSAENSINEFKEDILEKLKQSFRRRADVSKSIRAMLDELPENVIVCGDFNDVPGSWAYRTLMADDFRDAYTATNRFFTHTFNQHRFYFHIDQILYRGLLKPLSVEVGNIDCSDHYPQMAYFMIEKPLKD